MSQENQEPKKVASYARRSGLHNNLTPYECLNDWGDIPCQCGSNGIVLTRQTMQETFNSVEATREAVTGQCQHYRTAFFEAFPQNPSTFVRGEGATVEEAEQSAWEQWQAIQACPGHEFERGKYTNGAGTCKHCNMFSSEAFKPTEKCCICGVPTYWDVDTQGKFYCEQHDHLVPGNYQTPIHRMINYLKEELK